MIKFLAKRNSNYIDLLGCATITGLLTETDNLWYIFLSIPLGIVSVWFENKASE